MNQHIIVTIALILFYSIGMVPYIDASAVSKQPGKEQVNIQLYDATKHHEGMIFFVPALEGDQVQCENILKHIDQLIKGCQQEKEANNVFIKIIFLGNTIRFGTKPNDPEPHILKYLKHSALSQYFCYNMGTTERNAWKEECDDKHYNGATFIKTLYGTISASYSLLPLYAKINHYIKLSENIRILCTTNDTMPNTSYGKTNPMIDNNAIDTYMSILSKTSVSLAIHGNRNGTNNVPYITDKTRYAHFIPPCSFIAYSWDNSQAKDTPHKPNLKHYTLAYRFPLWPFRKTWRATSLPPYQLKQPCRTPYYIAGSLGAIAIARYAYYMYQR